MSTPYLTASAADVIAATLPDLSAWSAATTDEKSAALLRATLDIDNGIPYQGRKYDAAQGNAFPRVPYDEPSQSSASSGVNVPDVWDWDAMASEAVVPQEVLLAVVYQADAILAGERDLRITAQHDGVVYDQTGSVAESYKQTEGPGVTTGLCRTAWVLLRKYRLKGGKLL